MVTVQIDFHDPDSTRGAMRFVDPVEIVRAETSADVLPALRRVQEAVDGGLFAVGFVSYEAAPAFDPAMTAPHTSELPLVWFGLYRAPQSVDEPEMSGSGAEYRVGEWTCPVDEARFGTEIASIRESIAAGDVYQVNHTVRMRASFAGDAFAWYRRLRGAQRASYSAYLDIDRFAILSLSPELFFQVRPAQNKQSTSPPELDTAGEFEIGVSRQTKLPTGKSPKIGGKAGDSYRTGFASIELGEGGRTLPRRFRRPFTIRQDGRRG